MGLVKQTCQDKIRHYSEETEVVKSVLYDIGKELAPLKLGPLMQQEAKTLIEDLDKIADSRANEAIAVAVAEEIDAIITAVRLVNAETRAGYGGITQIGTSLDITWLRGVHVGDTNITNNSTSTASKGLYAGTGGAVYDWLATWVKGTSQTWYPSQAMTKEAAIVFLGFMDTIEVPKVSAVRFTLSGVTTAVQPLLFNVRRSQSSVDTTFCKLKKPVLFAPRKTYVSDFYPNISGDSKVEPVALLVTMSQNLTA